ncbi:MAG: hypothetical protein ACTSRM_03700 [Alphaproteobacteria bacterium]|jgi:hypothetical protein|uniref:hypothetical protein n=1 Tax=Methyloceanibacter sp. TaxID=1965321 RepID=UPI00356A2BFB
MKTLRLSLVLCGALGLALLPARVSAFEIQGQDAELPKSAAEYHGLTPTYTMPRFEGSSLAMPYSSSNSLEGHISDYGNSITIPGPGVDQAAPAWAYR